MPFWRPSCLLTSAVTVVCANVDGQACAEPKPAAVTAIHAAVLIDGVSAQPRHNVLIMIRGNRIESVTRAALHRATQNSSTCPRTLPCCRLIDTHTHIFLQGEAPEEGGYDVQLLKHPSSYGPRGRWWRRAALWNSFTTLRDVETEGAGYGDVVIRGTSTPASSPGRACIV